MEIAESSIQRLRRHGLLEREKLVLDLGDGSFVRQQDGGSIPFKQFLEEHQMCYVDVLDVISVNGQKGIDIDTDIHGQAYPLILDYGTTTVMDELYECFKMINELCSVGGIMVHELPQSVVVSDDGNHAVSREFFKELSQSQGYKIHELREDHKNGLVCAVLEKTTPDPFVDSDDFDEFSFYSK